MRLNWNKSFGLTCLALSLGLSPVLTTSAFADAKVDVTSFVYLNNNLRPVAELCGRVTGATGPSLVRVTVDVTSNNPGIYHASTGTDGLFCTLVATYRGSANVSLETTPPPTSSPVTTPTNPVKPIESGVVMVTSASSR